jgi:molecular chaperone HtpG
MAKHEFQTEVKQLLKLVINSLYSHKEIFLRELISNSSDAIDKLKYLTLTDDKFKDMDFKPKITIAIDEKDKSISIVDNGIGMNEKDLMEHLGTIAKSGTKGFLDALSGDAKKDSNLIGQFGVGFYSAFMVASHIDVISRKAGEKKAYKWSSKGDGEYEVSTVTKEDTGTVIYLKIKDEDVEYLDPTRLKTIIEKYSNHVPCEVFLKYTDIEYDEISEEDRKAGKESKSKEVAKLEQVNKASAIWTRAKKELKAKDYNEFYKSFSNDADDSLTYVHTHTEGALEYKTLFYIPRKAPMDMYRVDYKSNVKLYVNRVFITDDDKELLPTYLRFVKGVIDSSDLPLNVSREILQQNKVLANIKQASIKKILSQIKKISKDEEKYEIFVKEFNRPLKEGLYQDFTNKEALLELVRFKSTKSKDKMISLETYKNNMKEDQKNIYYIIGQDKELVSKSPLLEKFKKQDIEVLILDDEIDDIIIPSITEYDGISLKSVSSNDSQEALKDKKDDKVEEKSKEVIEKIKEVLKDEVKDVKVSYRLDTSPSCIVVDENDPQYQMQKMMRSMGQAMPEEDIKPILEINPTHKITKKLTKMDIKTDEFKNICHLLLGQAMLAEGIKPNDIIDFNERLNSVIGMIK